MSAPDTPHREAADRGFWIFPMLAVLVAVIVVLPYWLLSRMDARAVQAQARVDHSREVTQAAFDLSYTVRSTESAMMALAIGADVPIVRERLAQGAEQIPELLARLQRLTRENPEQQLRIGRLQGVIEQRLALSRRVLTGGPTVRDDAVELAARFPVRNALADFRAEEDRLLAKRSDEVQRLDILRNRVALLSTVLQLALLGMLLFLARRQVTQRLQAERRSRDDAAYSAAVMEGIREPILLLDDRQRVLLRNPAFAELHGRANGEDAVDFHGQPLAQVASDIWTDGALQRRLQDALLRGRELWDHEQLYIGPDGAERTMLLNARPVQLPGDAGRALLVTAADISLQKADERRIHDLNRQLQGKIEQVSDVNRELEAFSYSVSHDLRAPLRHITAFADKLGRQLGDAADDKSRHYLKVIAESSQRMAALIDDLLVYSRLGRSALRLQQVDMQSLVDETRAMLEDTVAVETPGRRIEWRVAPSLPVLVGDENMLRQVWLNVLGNAVKYTAARDPALIEIGYRQLDDGSHEFRVRDNGAGFDMAYAGKLFGVFQRMHKASEFPGTGIGLASVRRVLARHGGHISAQSAVGEGSTFVFTLPSTQDSPAPADTSDP